MYSARRSTNHVAAVSLGNRSRPRPYRHDLRIPGPHAANLYGWPGTSQGPRPHVHGALRGRYEGDALVVDTIGFNDKTWLDPMGLPHSDALRVVERFRRVDHDTLQIDYTIDDPKAYTKTWTAQRIFKLKPDWEIKEYVCAENNEVK